MIIVNISLVTNCKQGAVTTCFSNEKLNCKIKGSVLVITKPVNGDQFFVVANMLINKGFAKFMYEITNCIIRKLYTIGFI